MSRPLYTSGTLITEKIEAYTTEAVSISLDTAVDSIEELTIDKPIAIDETTSLEPILKTGDPKEEPTLSLEPLLEIGEPESEEVAMDLDENEIALDLDFSPSIPPPLFLLRHIV